MRDAEHHPLKGVRARVAAYHHWKRIGFVLTDAGRAVLEQEGGE